MPRHARACRALASTSLAVSLALAGSACGNHDLALEDQPPVEALEASPGAAPDILVVPPMKSSVEVTSVTGSGNGCPDGTWRAENVDFGGARRLRVEFLGFEHNVVDGVPTSTTNCTLTVTLRSNEPVSVGVFSAAVSVRGTGASWTAVSSVGLNDAAPESFEKTVSVEEGWWGGISAEPTQWSDCRTDHVLHLQLTAKGGDRAGKHPVASVDYDYGPRRCVPRQDTEPLIAKAVGVRVEGPDCPDPSDTEAFRRVRIDSGYLRADFPGERAVIPQTPYQGRCTLWVDLAVPPGYQFRSPSLRWESRVWRGFRAADLSVTYAYPGSPAVRTEWSLPAGQAGVGPGFTRHAFDVWSPCSQPGLPVTLRVDLGFSLVPEVAGFARGRLELGFSAAIYNDAAVPAATESAEWRRCDASVASPTPSR